MNNQANTSPFEWPSLWLRADLFGGSVALVTGGGSGIGEATARMLALHGCAVAIADLNPASAQRVAEEIDQAGGAALAVAMDVTKAEQVQTAVGRAADWRGRLDIIVNNAGIVLAGNLIDVDMKDWQTSFEVNVVGALSVSRAAFPHLRESDKASIVTVASISGGRAYPGGGAYGPSKAALISLTRQLAMEWAGYGIRANVVSPGTVLTPLMFAALSAQGRADRAAKIPMHRLAQAREIASVITFLASPVSSYVTGQEIPVDGGLSQALMRQSFNEAASSAREEN